MSDDAQQRALETWHCARQALGGEIAALEFGDIESAIALGDQAEPARVISFRLSLTDLARKYFNAELPGEAAIEAAIAEVEERVMPLHHLFASGARCVTCDDRVRAIAGVLGRVDEPWATMSIDAVERVFNRWVSVALGRPATQDALPMSGEFAASLVALREWLHHLSLTEITVGTTPAECTLR